MSQRSSRLYFEVRDILTSSGPIPRDVFVCPANLQVLDCRDEQEAQALVMELNAAALQVLG